MAFLAMQIAILTAFALQVNAADNNFNTYYSPLWGQNHLVVNSEGTQVTLQLDKSSGAGFRSKQNYGSGLFHIKMKIPDKKSGGVVTTFYLINVEQNQAAEDHFELDFEFVGTTGQLNTNVFNNDAGHREESFKLWFDPSQDFHNYDILWNPRHIVFFVDNIPIRVFKNNTAQGLVYPFKPMHIEASIWDASGWAGITDWSLVPYVAYYQDFGFNACSVSAGSNCASQHYSWNQQNYMGLSDVQKQQMKEHRAKYMVFDYCDISPDKKRECELNEQLVDDEALWITAPSSLQTAPSSPHTAPSSPHTAPSTTNEAANCITSYVHMHILPALVFLSILLC